VAFALECAAWLLVTIVVVSVAFNALAYADAARARRRRAVVCPAPDDEVPAPARVLAAAASFARECAATAVVTLSAPVALGRRRVRRIDPGAPCRPVVLLHGYAQHTANFLWLVRRLRRDGWLHLYGVGHTPLWGDIERSAARLGAVIDRIRAESGATEVDVVAHSMGGLVARAYIRTRGARCGIGRLITLGTPHRGTEAFSWLRLDPMLAQMRRGSALLSRLGADDPVPALTDCTAISSRDDALVSEECGYYPGAFNIRVRGVGHLSLLFSKRVYELVRENLAPPVASAGVARRLGE
jgi:triacylglycerol esterase/lipase EstA (alpha/beta hydrolase family)